MEQQRFILTYGAESETLSINPEGWSTNGQSWQRDKKYWGVFQSYTVDSFRFSRKSGGGGDFIYDAYLIDDLKTVITVDVYDRNPQTDDYDLSYTGRLNFDKDKFKYDRDYLDIGFVQNSNLQNFITRDDIELDITETTSVDGTEMTPFVSSPKSITFKKIDIYRILESSGNMQDNFYYSVTEDPIGAPSGTWYQPSSDPIYIKYYADDVTINELGDSFKSTSGPTYSERSIEVYENEYDGIVNIEIDNASTSNLFRIEVWRYLFSEYPAEITFELVVEIFDSEDVEIFSTIVDSDSHSVDTPPPSVLNPYYIDIVLDLSSITGNIYPLSSGDKLRITTKVYTNDISQWQDSTSIEVTEAQTNMVLDFTEESLGELDSSVDSFFPYEAFTRLFQLITSEENTFYSEFFGRTDSEFTTYSENGQGALDAITTGWNLRQFPSKPFTLSLAELFKTFDSIYNLGMSYDQTNTRFFIEEKAEFYKQDTIMFDLGEVSELVISPFSDAYFNKIKGGFDNKGEYESLNGIKEFESITNWSTDQPVKEIQNIRSIYHADSIGMEFARRKNYDSYASEDTDYDDLTYVVRTDGSETLQGGTSLSGFAGIEQYYNVPLTPRENAIRWGNFLKSQYWREEEDFVIRFSKSTKAVNITYENQNGEVVDEFDDIQASEIPDLRLFNPQYYEFKGVFDLTKAEALNTDPHGVILFSFEGVGYAGFVDDIQSEDYNRKATYKLIATEATQDVQKVFIAPDDDALFMDDDNHLFM